MTGVGSLMAQELRESAATVARLVEHGRTIRALGVALADRRPPFVVVCGRGSSGHAGVYLRYLVEARLGLVVSAAAPSIVTSYRRPSAMAGALFVVISQSGRSPDLVAATEAAAAAGAVTVAIVNDAASPVAAAARHVLAIGAGPERSVAATKTVIGSMAVSAILVAAMADDDALAAALRRFPDRLARAGGLDWSAWGNRLASARAVFVAARGYGFGPAREIALKVSETLRLPALAYSAAELRHGPRAAVQRDTPVLALRQADPTAGTVDRLVADLALGGIPVHVAGRASPDLPSPDLPWLGDDHPALDPVAMLVPAYAAIERAARAAGFDPDRPPHLSKVTETL